MKNKELIRMSLVEIQNKTFDGDDFVGITASQLSEVLGLHRTVVSKYLTELYREGIVIKSATRPVYFKNIVDINVKKEGSHNNINDPFSKLIGYDSSMYKQIEKCKTAILYPNKGMHIMLLGDSGVGKSYLAQIIYDYAKYKECICKEAPFVTFNCADYSNNPELLSAYLFGYKKGAFTGADRDTLGLIETANNGYLFLDEIHRLPPEGQEKLFVFLDKGVFRRVGSNVEIQNINVKFIFATTEDISDVLLETFCRRIPLNIKIPSFIDRPIEERLTLIYYLFDTESRDINAKFMISNKVINILLYFDKKGNVGALKNEIKFCCASAYRNNLGSEIINVDVENLPTDYLPNDYQKKFFCEEFMVVDGKDFNKYKFLNSTNNNIQIVEKFIDKIYKILVSSNNLLEDEIKLIIKEMNKLIDKCFYYSNIKNMEQLEMVYMNCVDDVLKLIQNKYGIKYYGNSSRILAKLILNFKYTNEISEKKYKEKCKSILNFLEKNYSKIYMIGNNLINLMQESLTFQINLRTRIMICIYVLSIVEFRNSTINAIIVAHGYSTASSISSLTNRVYQEFIFEAFDMPIEMSPKVIIAEITNYLKNINTEKGVIILVDMGSLFNITNDIKKHVSGDIGIINNITTQIALDVGNRIMNNQNIEFIMKKVQKDNLIDIKFIKNSKKKRCILTTCISGIATAIKLRDLMKLCLEDEDLEVIEYDYKSLLINGSNDDIFDIYDVKLIISTIDVKVDGIESIVLPDIIEGKSAEKVKLIFKEMNLKKNVDDIFLDIIKYFSVENIINQLTILNPNKIINDVEKIIFLLESKLDVKFEYKLKVALYIHISLFAERAILGDQIENEKDYNDFEECNKKFIKAIKKSFCVIEKQYKFTINITEMNLIYQIIEGSMSKNLNNKQWHGYCYI